MFEDSHVWGPKERNCEVLCEVILSSFLKGWLCLKILSIISEVSVILSLMLYMNNLDSSEGNEEKLGMSNGNTNCADNCKTRQKYKLEIFLIRMQRLICQYRGRWNVVVTTEIKRD